jgi:hypothetical protein
MNEHLRNVPVTVVREAGQVEETCNLGHKHTVKVWARKVLGPVVEMREHNNGYERRMTEVRKDAQGREYHEHITIDYSNNISWAREDGVRFEPYYPARKYDRWL